MSQEGGAHRFFPLGSSCHFSCANKKTVSNASTEVHALSACTDAIRASVHHSLLWNMRWPCTCVHAQCHNQPKFSIAMHVYAQRVAQAAPLAAKAAPRGTAKQGCGAYITCRPAPVPPSDARHTCCASSSRGRSSASQPWMSTMATTLTHLLGPNTYRQRSSKRVANVNKWVSVLAGVGGNLVAGANIGKGRLKSISPIRTPRAHKVHLRTWAGHVACRVGGGWELVPGE